MKNHEFLYKYHDFIGVRISSTFSVLRPFSYLRPFLYFDLFTSTRALRLAYFDLLSNLDLLLVEKYRSKYSFRRSKAVEVKFGQKSRSKVGRSTEKYNSNNHQFGQWKVPITRHFRNISKVCI